MISSVKQPLELGEVADNVILPLTNTVIESLDYNENISARALDSGSLMITRRHIRPIIIQVILSGEVLPSLDHHIQQEVSQIVKAISKLYLTGLARMVLTFSICSIQLREEAASVDDVQQLLIRLGFEVQYIVVE